MSQALPDLQDQREQPDHRELQAQLVLQEPMASRERLALKDKQVHRVLLDFKVQPEPQAPLALKGKQVHRVLQDRLDPKELRVPLVLQDLLVLLVHKARREFKELPVHAERLVFRDLSDQPDK